MLYRLWCFIILLFNFIPKEQKVIIAHVFEISTVSPESFKYNSIDQSWISEKLSIKFYPETGNVYIRGMIYPLIGKAKRKLINHFKNINLMLHHRTISNILLNSVTTTEKTDTTNSQLLVDQKLEEGFWSTKQVILPRYLGQTITVKLRSGEIVEGLVQTTGSSTMYPYVIKHRSYTKKGIFSTTNTLHPNDIVAIFLKHS